MNKLNLKFNFSGIDIDANFKNNFGILVRDSGTGKTLLMKAAELYCLKNDIAYQYMDSNTRTYTQEQILNILSDKEVVLLDNADLYLTNDILNTLRSDTNRFILICIKDTSKLNIRYASEYFVHYRDLYLTIEEL